MRIIIRVSGGPSVFTVEKNAEVQDKFYSFADAMELAEKLASNSEAPVYLVVGVYLP